MARYRVRLTKEVSDTLDAFVEVEAATEDEAGEKAIAEATRVGSEVAWEFAYGDEGGAVEVDSIEVED